jgi:hypothetical protein
MYSASYSSVLPRKQQTKSPKMIFSLHFHRSWQLGFCFVQIFNLWHIAAFDLSLVLNFWSLLRRSVFLTRTSSGDRASQRVAFFSRVTNMALLDYKIRSSSQVHTTRQLVCPLAKRRPLIFIRLLQITVHSEWVGGWVLPSLSVRPSLCGYFSEGRRVFVFCVYS